ncbi:LysR substrate-binding domain-containing protein [Pelagibius marinus]|uniref:LysR substrate-binding domain-containing protein n=1 Tax=Pelagibius marinus TaxID=2762760 RepID=UPI0018722F0D|nr:LysR substrate-binding domain-containing protein [Pelagibius marinus]
MKDLPLNALRAFAAVYDRGGLRPAARALQITHSSVSRHLRELEHWLGVPLVERETQRRSLAFTPQGEALGRASLDALGKLGSAVAALREARRGNAVSLATTPSIAANWLFPRLADFEASLGWIELSVTVDQRPALPGHLDADLALRMGRGPWPGFHCQPLMDDALYPVMSPAYWKSAGCPSEPRQLQGLRLLHDRDPQAAWEIWRRHYDIGGADLRSGPRYASSDLVLRAALQGLGVALARHRLTCDHLRSGALIRPFGSHQVDLADAYWLLTPEGTPSRTAVAQVAAWLRSEAAGFDSLPPQEP